MKLFSTAFALSLIFAVSAQAQSTCDDSIVKQKKTQFGTNYLSCQMTDWGVTPMSASYQPANQAPLTARPEEVKSKTEKPQYENFYPGIKDTRTYFEGSFDYAAANGGTEKRAGLPLAMKFVSANLVRDEKTGASPDISNWMNDEFFPQMKPTSGSSSWEGKCYIWASWSMDPVLRDLFSKMNDGIWCGGFPFSKGELKEIVTALYPGPDVIRTQSLTKFYHGYYGSPDRQLEDANVALAKMGLLGDGDFSPSDIGKTAAQARAAGHNLMMDRDGGDQTWNHAFKKVVDVAYRDSATDHTDLMSIADYQPASTDAQATYRDLLTIEKEFTAQLTIQNGVERNLCNPNSDQNRNFGVPRYCEKFKGVSDLAAQVDVFNRMKRDAVAQKLIQFKADPSVNGPIAVKHELTIELGDEIEFASNKPDQIRTQTYTYTALHAPDASAPNGVGSLIRSRWTPETRKLSEACADGNFGKRDANSLAHPIDQAKRCPVKAGDDQEVFVGNTPPNNLTEFRAVPAFVVGQEKQRAAYNKFLDFMRNCPTFDHAAQFLRDLDAAALNNDISAEEADALFKQYQRKDVRALLAKGYLDQFVAAKGFVNGLAQLKARFDSVPNTDLPKMSDLKNDE